MARIYTIMRAIMNASSTEGIALSQSSELGAGTGTGTVLCWSENALRVFHLKHYNSQPMCAIAFDHCLVTHVFVCV